MKWVKGVLVGLTFVGVASFVGCTLSQEQVNKIDSRAARMDAVTAELLEIVKDAKEAKADGKIDAVEGATLAVNALEGVSKAVVEVKAATEEMKDMKEESGAKWWELALTAFFAVAARGMPRWVKSAYGAISDRDE